jgi:hypothetical protein
MSQSGPRRPGTTQGMLGQTTHRSCSMTCHRTPVDPRSICVLRLLGSLTPGPPASSASLLGQKWKQSHLLPSSWATGRVHCKMCQSSWSEVGARLYVACFLDNGSSAPQIVSKRGFEIHRCFIWAFVSLSSHGSSSMQKVSTGFCRDSFCLKW